MDRRRQVWTGRDTRILVLTWVAGLTDAISYLGLGHVFTAMMTGNTVLLGLALAQGEVSAAWRSILALAGFAAGVAVGALIVERDRSHGAWPPAVTRALAVEGVVLALFTATWQLTGGARRVGVVYLLILLSGCAMGVQAAAVRRNRDHLHHRHVDEPRGGPRRLAPRRTKRHGHGTLGQDLGAPRRASGRGLPRLWPRSLRRGRPPGPVLAARGLVAAARSGGGRGNGVGPCRTLLTPELR